jgi:hypothetical protein
MIEGSGEFSSQALVVLYEKPSQGDDMFVHLSSKPWQQSGYSKPGIPTLHSAERIRAPEPVFENVTFSLTDCAVLRKPSTGSEDQVCSDPSSQLHGTA